MLFELGVNYLHEKRTSSFAVIYTQQMFWKAEAGHLAKEV
jgi:hypothetical protein